MKKTDLAHPKLSQADHEASEEDGHTFYGKSHFQHMLRIERLRTGRSKKPFLLLLLDISNLITKQPHEEILTKIKSALASFLRETDIRGWYDQNKVMGIIFTEMASLDEISIGGIRLKINKHFNEKLDAESIKKINISLHIYPEANEQALRNGLCDIKLYPDLIKRDIGKQIPLAVKNVVDIVGSSLALLLFSPLFLIITIVIKATSDGPVFFKQERLGLYGKPFAFLKFRSMYTNCDSANHKEYIKKYIGDQKSAAVEPGVFKLNNDPRVTPIGKLLRKTSLDELPQLINVLKGEMSLVGPRPPIPYECELYDTWHKRRLLSYKPGITGLWQVTGRSRMTFDEMVRVDLKYINEWSLWLDFKILLMTPKAVLTGAGAY